jgi:serine/threonine-protein kinase
MTSAPLTSSISRLGGYELVRLLASGGMADVYLARSDKGLAAVKVLNSSRARDAEACALFLDEARLVGMLEHPNLASVHEVDARDGVYFLAMEYVHGADLRDLLAHAQIADTAIDYACALSIVAAAAAGLDHAHRRCAPDGRPLHLVHRDVSLSNIMVGYDGTVKVIDFGIATSTASAHHTNPGIVRGKASYMSPEQCLGDPVDLRTDVFALGVVLYELVTGKRCFQGGSDFERMLAVVRGEYVPASTHVPELPASLETVIKTAMAIDPAKRYASAAAMLEALEAVASLEGWTLGTDGVSAMMRDLFGTPVEPWMVEEEVAISPAPAPFMAPLTPVVTWPGVGPAAARPVPTVVITRPRRFARGTECDVHEDEALTRGRRALPRRYATLTGSLAA